MKLVKPMSLLRSPLSEDWVFWTGMLAFRLVLDFSYQYYLNPVFKFDTPINFNYSVEVGRYLFSLLVYILLVSVVRSRAESVSNVFLFTAAIFLVAPMTSEYGLNTARPIAPVMCAVVALLVVDIVAKIRLPPVASSVCVPGGRKVAVVFSVIGIIYLLLWGWLSGAVQYLSFDLHRIYEFRDKVAELLDVGVLAYVNLWVYKVFTIFLVCVLLQHRRFGLLLLVMACQVYFFGLTSHRIVLFLPLLVVVIWVYLRKLNRLTLIPYVAAAGLLLALFIKLAWSVESVPEIAIRRAFFVPSGLIFQWFDYFDFHPHVYWADKLLSVFSDGSYVGVNVPRLIGDYLLPGSNSAANSGMIAAGYAQAGYLGVLLYAVILGLVLSVLDAIVRWGVPLWFVAALSIGPLRTAIADSDLLTALLSHGLGLVVLLLWLYGSDRTQNRRGLSGNHEKLKPSLFDSFVSRG